MIHISRSSGGRVRTPRLLHFAVAVALVAGMVVTAALPFRGARPASATTSGPRLARLTIVMTSSASPSTFRMYPGRLAGFAVTSNPLGVPASELSTYDGVQMSAGLTKPATVVFQVLYDEETFADPINFVITKGYTGKTSVSVSNDTTPTTFDVYDGTNDLSTGLTNSVYGSRTRSEVFGSVEPTLPTVDSRRLVLADYYPWFSQSSWSSSTLADHPVTPYSVWSYNDVLAMSQQARANGVDGFVVSYSGSADASAFNIALSAAANSGGVVTGYLETEIANLDRSTTLPSDPNVVVQWLAGLMMAANNSSAFLRAPDNIPIVFVYDMYRLSPSQWQSVLTKMSSGGMPVHLIGDGGYPQYLPVEWGYAAYNPNSSTPDQLQTGDRWAAVTLRGQSVVDGSAPHAYAATVSPGFNDTNLRGSTNPIVSRDGGARYTATWSAALNAAPDYVLVTSWNEWYEDTEIQPGVTTGSQALTQTGQYSATFKAS